MREKLSPEDVAHGVADPQCAWHREAKQIVRLYNETFDDAHAALVRAGAVKS